MITKGAKEKFCVFQTYMPFLEMNNDFLIELKELLSPGINTSQLANDVLNGSISREHLTRRVSGCYGQISPTNAFAIISALILRNKYHVFRGKEKRLIKKSEILAIRLHAYEYGISCVAGKCCNIVPSPIVIKKNARSPI